MRLLFALFATLALALPAAARPLTGAETRSLEKALRDFDRALTGRDSARLVAAIPPRIIAMIAGQSGMELAALQKAMAEQSDAALAGVTFTDLTTDPSRADAATATLGDGSTVTWALVPVSFVMDKDGTRQLFRQTILALNEADTWYLLRIEDPQQRDLVAAVYPFLADVAIPPTEVGPAP